MKLALALLFCVVCANVAYGHPQLFAEETVEPEVAETEEPSLTRTRRDSHGHHGWGWPKQHKGWGWGWPSVGPVFTYVRTDGWSNFQWGVRHKVGGGGWKGWSG